MPVKATVPMPVGQAVWVLGIESFLPPSAASQIIDSVTRAMRFRTLGGRTLAKGSRIALNWAFANRDEAVFGDSDEFRLDCDPELNLLYGAGIPVCPGAPLARLELRIVMEELLGAPAGLHWRRIRYQ
jgi:cytochrome P450